MLTYTQKGLFCNAGNFYIDPIRPVKTAIITHGHADHARWGMGHYIATPDTCSIMNVRIGADISTESYPYHQSFDLGSVKITFIPAGHILGSAQVVIDDGQSRAIVTGDFKTDYDPTVDAFESQPTDLLVMETTFALPIYHWPPPNKVFEDINQFWKTNQANGLHTILYAYSLGKAQRLIAGIDHSIGPVAVHSAVEKMNQLYIDAGKLNHQPPNCTKEWLQECNQPGLIIAPPAVIGSSWLKKLTPYREAYVSGWMLSKGQVRRRNMHGFVLSDHADWNGLNHAVKKMNPSTVWTMHGSTDIYAKYLTENGIDARPLSSLQLERSE